MVVAGGDYIFGVDKLVKGTGVFVVALAEPVPGDEVLMFIVAVDGALQMYDGITGAMTAIDGVERLSALSELGNLLAGDRGAAVGEILDATVSFGGLLQDAARTNVARRADTRARRRVDHTREDGSGVERHKRPAPGVLA